MSSSRVAAREKAKIESVVATRMSVELEERKSGEALLVLRKRKGREVRMSGFLVVCL